MSRMTLDQAMRLALQHHQAGRLHEAERIYRQILSTHPEHPDALHLLGAIAYQAGRHDQAEQLVRRAIAANPGAPEFHNTLGLVLLALGRTEPAIAAFRSIIRLRPHDTTAHYNLGNALLQHGQLDAAIDSYRTAIQLQPDLVDARLNLGNALQAMGNLDQAVDAYRQAVAVAPDHTAARNNLGNALRDSGLLEQAIAEYRRALELDSSDPDIHNNLGTALLRQGQLDAAASAFQTALRIKPDLSEAHSNLGNILRDQGQLDAAIEHFQQALAADPRSSETLNNFGNVLKDQARLDEAIDATRRAIDLNPRNSAAQSNLLFTLHYHPGYDAKAIFDAHRRWNDAVARPLAPLRLDFPNDPDPGRRLRIGFVSPDFRDHVIGRMVLPLLERLDRTEFEVCCYSNVALPDRLTPRFQSIACIWRDIACLSDDAAAGTIRQDRIDILIDLAAHSGSNRMLVFARKPAPVQMTWLGYPGTSGLDTMDYRITDRFLDPPGLNEAFHSEQLIRLDGCFWHFNPLDDAAQAGPLPADSAGFITFGCLNNFCKINPLVLGLWARVLKAVPDARLHILASPGRHRQQMLDRLRSLGIDPQRVQFVDRRPRPGYLELYRQIDIALDTFPYNGHTTTLDALWMGVPTISLAGQTSVSRAGLSILSNVALPELATEREEEYVRLAAELAGDRARLRELRSSLRDRLGASPLMDDVGFTRNMQDLLRGAWRRWCEQDRQPG